MYIFAPIYGILILPYLTCVFLSQLMKEGL